MEKKMEKLKNIIIVEKYYSKVNTKMEKDTSEKNIIMKILWYTKEGIQIEDIMEKGKSIIMIMEKFYSKVNF